MGVYYPEVIGAVILSFSSPPRRTSQIKLAVL